MQAAGRRRYAAHVVALGLVASGLAACSSSDAESPAAAVTTSPTPSGGTTPAVIGGAGAPGSGEADPGPVALADAVASTPDEDPLRPPTGSPPRQCDAGATLIGLYGAPARCMVNNRPNDFEMDVSPRIAGVGTTVTATLRTRNGASLPTRLGWNVWRFYPWGRQLEGPAWYPIDLPPLRLPGGSYQPDSWFSFGTVKVVSGCTDTSASCSFRIVQLPTDSGGEPFWHYVGVAIGADAVECGNGLKEAATTWVEGYFALAFPQSPEPSPTTTAPTTTAPATTAPTTSAPEGGAPRAVLVATQGPYDPATVTFDASGSTDPDGEPLAYRWTFGDEAPGTASLAGPATVTHTYPRRGAFTARVQVLDAESRLASAAVTVGVHQVTGRIWEEVCGRSSTRAPAGQGALSWSSGTGFAGGTTRKEELVLPDASYSVVVPRGEFTVEAIPTALDRYVQAPAWAPPSRTRSVTSDLTGLDFTRCYSAGTPATAQVTLANKTYRSATQAVQGGGAVRICDQDGILHRPWGRIMETGATAFAAPDSGLSGKCRTFPVPANRTGKVQHLELFDRLHPREYLILPLLPR